MFDRQRYIELGMLRRCECHFESLDRTEFRRHLIETGHSQNMKGRNEAAHVSDEEKMARMKNRR